MTTKISTANLDSSITTLIGSGGGPKVTAITYPGNDLAADPAGGQTITLTGTGFVSGCSVFVGTTQASVVTVVSATSVTFTSPALAAATYTLYLVNPDGGTATIVPGISYSGTPIWSTTAGTLGSVYEYAAISNTVAATGDGSIIYSVFSGTLPTGSSLNTSTGVISGTSPASAGATTYTFVIRATDAQLQDSDRTFSITINTDTVTWSTPANNSTTTLGKDVASSTTLLATSAAGNAITYSSTALPTGLSISGATVTGTPTVVGNTTSTFTATAATTNKTTTAVINWTVSVASDTYFPYTTLLLSGAAATETFIADASTNNFAVTIAGDTKPNNFNPYTPGYYSVYSNNTGVLSNVTTTTISAGVFTFEGWFNLTAVTAVTFLMGLGTNTGGSTPYFNVSLTSSGTVINVECYSTVTSQFIFNANYTWPLNRWVHLAAVGNGTTVKVYVNGVGLTTTLGSGTFPGSYLNTLSLYPWVVGLLYGGGGARSDGVNGYVSNFRFVNGTAVYTADFTPSTTPLTAISGTAMLACQSNRLINSNNVSLTTAGSTSVQSFNPFVPNTAYATQGSTYFDGSTDYLTTPTNAAFGFGTGDFTVEGWYYLTAIVTEQALLMLGTGANGAGPIYCGWWLKYSSLGALIFYRYDGTETTYSFSTTLVVNTWYHIACSRSGTSLRMFLNGAQIGATASSNLSFNNANSDPLQIGKCITGQGTFYYNGYISNIRIVKGVAVYTANFTPPTTPLSATQSADTNGNPSAAITGSATSLLTCQTNQPASNSMFLDSSTNAFPVTRAGNVSAGTFTPYGANWSNYFGNSNSSISPSANSAFTWGTGNYTIEMWYNPSVSYAAGNGYLFDQASNGTRVQLYNNYVKFYYNNGGSELISSTAGLGLTVGSWHHLAIVRNTGVITMYINGTSCATVSSAANETSTSLRIGDYGGSSYAFNGYISNFRAVKGTAVYTGNFTVPTAPLTAVQASGTNISAITGSATSLLTCQSNGFVDNSVNAFAITTLIGTPTVQRFSPFSPQTQTAITHSGYFDGTTDYLATPSNAAFGFGTGDFTIECWIYPTGGGSRLLEFSSNTDNVDYSTSTGTIGYYNGSASVNSAGGLINANTWAHIAIVRLTGTVRVYVNGVLAVTQASTPNSSTRTLYIGGVTNGFYTGYISNARVVKGVAVYTANFTVPTAPLTATQSAGTNIAAITGTQTSLLTCQSPTFTDNSTNLFAITAFGEAKPRTLNPFGFTNTSAAYSAATYGGSAYFDGNADYLTLLTNPPTYAYKSGNFCLECWHYMPTAFSGYQYLVSFWNSAPYKVVILGYDGSTTAGRPTFYWTTDGSTDKIITASNAVPINQWNHIAVMRTANTISLFVNGVRVATASESGTLNSTGLTGMSTIMAHNAGAEALTPGYLYGLRSVIGSNPYDATLTTLAVPTAPLTAITNTSLLLNMTSAGVYDSASGNNLETVADAKRVATHTPYAGSFYSNYFNSSSDSLTVPSNAAFAFPGEFTVEGWFNWSTLPAAGQAIGVLAAGGFNFTYGSGSVSFNNYGSGSIATATYTFVVGVWYHIAMTRNVSNTCTIWINGVSIATANSAASFAQGTWTVYGGSNNGGAGYVNNLRVVKGVAVYTAAFTVPTAPLTATQAGNGATISAITTGTSLLTCQSNRFVDNSANAFAITKYNNASIQSFNPFQRNSATTMSFDGTTDALFEPSNLSYGYGTRDFTIEVWLYLNATTTQTIVSNLTASSGASVAPHIYYANASGIRYYVNSADRITGSALSTGTWYHIAVSRSGSSTKMFINGTQTGSTYTDTNNYGTSNPLGVGDYAVPLTGSGTLNGYINDLRITKGIARYTSTFTPPTTAFIAR